jgi:hypothetical protein
MIIANIKSNNDLENKRRLQQQILELEIANEAEQEKRMSAFKNPYKAKEVPPVYKSASELRKDKIEQERIAIKNMEDLGFDYQQGAELVAWLSSSDVNKLIEFNTYYKGIKKELMETTNPKLLTLEFLKNYLEKYFEDLETSQGRRFAQQAPRETQEVLGMDELMAQIPTHDAINELKNDIIRIQGVLSGINATSATKINRLESTTFYNEEEKRNIKAQIEKERGVIEIVQKYFKKGVVSIALMNIFNSAVPDAEFFTTLKLALPPNQRTDLVRRYGRALKNINAIDAKTIDELIEEASVIPDITDKLDERIKLLYGKMERAFAFLGNDKGVNAITLISRQYENELSKEGKIPELTKIKRYNDIQQQELAKAQEKYRESMNAFSETLLGEDYELTANAPPLSNAGPQKLAEFRAQELRQEAANEEQRARDLYGETRLALEEHEELKRKALEERQQKIAADKERRIALLQQMSTQKIKRVNENLEREKKLPIAEGYYSALYDEFTNAPNKYEAMRGLKGLLESLGVGARDLKKAGYVSHARDEDKITVLLQVLAGWIQENRITPYENQTLPADYDFTGEQGRALQYAVLNRKTGQPTIRGVGLRPSDIGFANHGDKHPIKAYKGYGLVDQISTHFREDEATGVPMGQRELKRLKKSFKKHKKEEEIDASSAESSEEEETRGGRGRGLTLRGMSNKEHSDPQFKHKRIKVGKGVSGETESRYRQFGKYVIHIPHLINDNVANFKYPSLGSIPSIRPRPVSEEYRDFLIDTLDNDRINERKLGRLSEDERLHFEKVSKGAGLLQKFQLKRLHGDKEQEETERFNVLRGEVLAGNNNKNVIAELRGLIVKMVNDNRIRRNEGLNMLMELSTF